MKTFEEAWEFTDQIPGSFTTLSGRMLYQYAACAPIGGVFVEVGVDQGRSASLLLEVASNRGSSIQVILVDKWESILIDNMAKVERMAAFFPDALYDIWNLSSTRAAAQFNGEIDLLHIDACHYDDITDGGPDIDCKVWLPKVKPGGVACFHDYDSTFKDVKKAVDYHTAGWEDLGSWDSLAIRRKPAPQVIERKF